MSDPYREYARVYDQHIGARDEPAVVQRLIRRHRSSAVSVLEFACGTGAILAPLSKHYDIYGVDISEPMLAVARAKLEHGSFVKGDMCRVRLKQRFDVVLCVFNSINHLQRFSDWKLLFRNAYRHLNPGGLFIFDINTETAFKNYSEAGHMIEEYDQDIMASSFSSGPCCWAPYTSESPGAPEERWRLRAILTAFAGSK